jgi:Spy/CpxP family protein refolding chaperone
MKAMSAAVFLIAAAALAQQPGPDPFADVFFPPELIMQNQQALGLTAEQKTALRGDVQSAQGKFTELQWKLQDELERLTALAREVPPNEDRVLAQLDKVLALEREVKRTHLTLVIRMKRSLTPDQQRLLQEIRKRMPPQPPSSPPRPPRETPGE